ncbi:MAG: adenylate/guanylate cyclase domain-containing protein, partial [Betaproteobacteria bacterium]
IIGYRLGWPMLPLIAPTLALFLGIWAMDFLDGRHERARRRTAQQTLARDVSPAVATRLLSGTDNRIGSARHQEASFLFTDIEGFTELSERLAPDTLASLLNDYLDGACKVIFEHEGTIDKFIGDGIMVVFNSPVLQADQAGRALRGALALDRYAQAFRSLRAAQGVSLGVTRIGLHCGAAHIGSFGSYQRMEFTALGDAVNTASRIEKANRVAGTRVCLSAAVVARHPDPLYLPIGQVKLPGKEQPLMLYTHATALDGGLGLARD